MNQDFSENDDDILHLTYTNHRGEKKIFKLDATQVKVRNLLKKKLDMLRDQVAQSRIKKDYNGHREPQTVIDDLSDLAIGHKV